MNKRKLKKLTTYELFLKAAKYLDGLLELDGSTLTFYYSTGHIRLNKASDYPIFLWNPKMKLVCGSRIAYLRKRLIKCIINKKVI